MMTTQQWQTSLTLIHDLHSDDPALRAERIATLVRIYRPVWLRSAQNALRRHGYQQLDIPTAAEDIVSEEINKMINPDRNYFKTYDRNKGRLGSWVARCCWYRAIDLLRRKRPKPLPDEIPAPPTQDQDELDTIEMYELVKESFRLAELFTERDGSQKSMEIFKAVRLKSSRMSVEERRQKGWTEFKERQAVRKVWDLIRNTTIPLAADSISSSPEDAIAIAQRMWDFLKPRGLISDPREI